MRADLPAKRQRLREIIRDRSLLQDRGFVLSSGRSSNFFFDMKRTLLDPEGAGLVADLLFDMIRGEDVDAVGGLETGAIPIVALLCARSWPEKPITGFFVRKEAKGHGTDQRIRRAARPRRARHFVRGCHHHRRLGHAGGRTGAPPGLQNRQ